MFSMFVTVLRPRSGAAIANNSLYVVVVDHQIQQIGHRSGTIADRVCGQLYRESEETELPPPPFAREVARGMFSSPVRRHHTQAESGAYSHRLLSFLTFFSGGVTVIGSVPR